MSTNLERRVILLADDDPDDAEMFGEVLAEIDSSVEFYHVKNGVAVFDYLKEKENLAPNVIFLDINMPQMSGWQCLSLLKSDPATKDIPVLIYSTSSHQRDKQIAIELGASGFITKPSNYKMLHSMLTIIAANLHRDIASTINSLQ